MMRKRTKDNIGPGADLDFPDGCYLLADKAYPNRHPLMTPYKAAQTRRIDVNLHTAKLSVDHLIANTARLGFMWSTLFVN